MQVILKKQIDNRGAVGDVIKVADGYARNYLFPKGFAIPVIPKSLTLITRLKNAEEKRLAEELKEAEMIIKQIEKISCSFKRLADENHHLYGSVNENDIVKALEEKGLSIDKNNVKMEHHIKKIGNHLVNIEINENIKGKLKIKIEEEKKEKEK